MADNYINALSNAFLSKEYSRDMVWDLCLMISERLMFFGDKVDDFERNRAENTINELVHYSEAPISKFRMYIISGIQFVSFACYDFSADTIGKVFNTLKSEFELCDIMPSKTLDPNLVSTIYIFEEKKIIFKEDIYPAHLAWIMQGLAKYNVIKQEVL